MSEASRPSVVKMYVCICMYVTLKIDNVINVKLLVMKITVSNVMPKNGNLMTDHLCQFLSRFHALIDVYPADFLGWDPVPELTQWFLLCSPYALSRCLASCPLSCGIDFPSVITQAIPSPAFVRKWSREFPYPSPFFCLSALIKIVSLVKSTIIYVYDDVIMM